MIYNAHLRENDQRNYILEGIKQADDNDVILISDVDEIPNFNSIDLKRLIIKLLCLNKKYSIINLIDIKRFQMVWN